MQPLTPRRLERANSVLGWTLSVGALAIGVAMWRCFSSVDPPPPTAVLISSMVWVLCGMIGIFYNAKTSGLLSIHRPQAQTITDASLDLALLRLTQLQEQLDQNLITLAQYRQERREMLQTIQASPNCD